MTILFSCNLKCKQIRTISIPKTLFLISSSLFSSLCLIPHPSRQSRCIYNSFYHPPLQRHTHTQGNNHTTIGSSHFSLSIDILLKKLLQLTRCSWQQYFVHV